MNKLNDDTNFLFADPDFVTGFATVIDFGGTLPVYNESANDLGADIRAIASDWAITGKDIKESVENFEKKERQAAESNRFLKQSNLA